ncbi:MAG TPA: biotin transporter BioY [Devosiaceae bacterium]|nr:biotin transporter BioY [Devosiaceae bacterium]
MAVTLTTPKTLFGAFAPQSQAGKLASGLATVLLGTLFIIACSKINVPTWPISVTLQTMAVAMLAAAFGWRIGVATVLLYIAEGLAGLPVFSVGGGPLYVFSPAFGFILGFIPMAAIIGLAADAGLSRRVLPLLGVMLLADAVCFVMGYGWLVAFLAQGKELGPVLGAAFEGAVKPFVVWDIVKMTFAAVSVTGAWSLLRRKA